MDRPGDVAAVLALAAPTDPLAADWPRARAEGNPWHRLLGHLPSSDDAATLDVAVAPHAGSGTPVLLAHGLDDVAVPPTQTLALAAALVAAGHPVHVTVADGAHGGLDLRRPDVAASIRHFLARRGAVAAPG
ncbi:alpha/beta hydrolase family protein [Micromonospora endolithica]|uniref:alpha/beta hydrolase family protein n=1 Tax=Micromonospora endolithica TaxID=230091 RepID=UPI0011AD1A31|nr:prolyl oligopeptidase family serine peptidase [Micromonospora endolithica]TWJ20243.1 prolyl oligopeptidase family protein [Micromonospora endolithica]